MCSTLPNYPGKPGVIMVSYAKPYGVGGGNVHVWETIKNLHPTDISVRVILPNVQSPEVHIKLNKIGSKYSSNKVLRAFFSFKSAITSRKILKEDNIRLLYTRSLQNMIALLLLSGRTKRVLEVNGLWSDERNTGNGLLKHVKLKIVKTIENAVINRVDFIVCVSEGIKDALINRGQDPKKIFVVENGADTDIFLPDTSIGKHMRSSLKLETEDIVIGFTGTIAHWQGLDELLSILPELLKKHQNIQLLIVGGGSYLDILQAKAQTLGVGDNVHFTGWVPYSQVPAYLNSFDIAVAPFKEGRLCSPIKIYEYLSCGLPTVSSDIPGINELAQRCESLLPYSAGDDLALVSTIEYAISNLDKLRTKSNQTRKLIVDEYSWVASTNKLISVWKNIINLYS